MASCTAKQRQDKGNGEKEKMIVAIEQRVKAEPDAWQKRRFELKCFHSPPISSLEERVCFDVLALGAQPLCRVDL